MISLYMRTDKPVSELYVYRDNECVSTLQWEAHRTLAETLHLQIDVVLNQAGVVLDNLNRIIVFRGPGSFTGLRIGISVANALGYALNIPVVGAEGDDWMHADTGKVDQFVPQMPVYGSDPHITQQKK